MFGLKNEEILTCLLLIVVGYFIAKMFSKRCNGFSVGGKACSGDWNRCNENECNVWKQQLIDGEARNLAPGGVASNYFCYDNNNSNWIATSVESETRARNYINNERICINCQTTHEEVICNRICPDQSQQPSPAIAPKKHRK
mgnify:CR=1 FL=1